MTSNSTQTQDKDVTKITLPVTCVDVLAGDLARADVVRLEQTYGNGDLIRVLAALGIAGPFAVLDSWQVRDMQLEGEEVTLINAGGYAALPFGESYPPLLEFLHQYLKRQRVQGLPQQAAATWRAALEANLVALLAQFAPSHADSQVFFSNSGAEAVEAAIKFARGSQRRKIGGKRTYIVNFSKSYHGKTLGALSLTPNPEYQAPFAPLPADVLTVPYGDAQAFRDILKQYRNQIAAIIIEPIQGEGGVIVPPAGYLAQVGEMARAAGILIIADEIQSGLGRTGHFFASIAAGLEPDIITLAKPLGGGLVPIGATIARKAIVKKVLGGLNSKRHSNTFGGGSLAMAVGLKSLELIVAEDLTARASRLGDIGKERLETLKQKYPNILSDVRSAGMLFALQFKPIVPTGWLGERSDINEVTAQLSSALALRALHQAGVHACYTLNSSATVRLTPPLNMPEDLFGEMFVRVDKALAAYPNVWQLLNSETRQTIVDLLKVM